MVQLSNILIGMIVMAAVVSGIMIFVADGVLQYGKTDLNDTSLTKLKGTYGTINQTVDSMAKNISVIGSSEAGIIDKLGAFFGSGYNAVKTVTNSFTSFFTVTEVAIGEGSFLLGGYSGLLIGFITTIIIVVFVIAIIMHFLIKSDRI